MKAVIEYYRRKPYIIDETKIYVYIPFERKEITFRYNGKRDLGDVLLEEIAFEAERYSKEGDVLVVARIDEAKEKIVIGYKGGSGNEAILFPSLARLKKIGIVKANSDPQQGNVKYVNFDEEAYVYDMPLEELKNIEAVIIETNEGTKIITRGELEELASGKRVKVVRRKRSKRKTRRRRRSKTG